MDPSTRAFLEQLQPDENLGQFLSRSVSDTIKSGALILDRQTRFHKTDVVEICGQAGTGKTELLYSVRCLNHNHLCNAGRVKIVPPTYTTPADYHLSYITQNTR